MLRLQPLHVSWWQLRHINLPSTGNNRIPFRLVDPPNGVFLAQTYHILRSGYEYQGRGSLTDSFPGYKKVMWSLYCLVFWRIFAKDVLLVSVFSVYLIKIKMWRWLCILITQANCPLVCSQTNVLWFRAGSCHATPKTWMLWRVCDPRWSVTLLPKDLDSRYFWLSI